MGVVLLFALGLIADIAGVLSFVLAIVLLVKSEALRKEIDSQRNEYQKNQKNIKIKMMAMRANAWDDQILNLKIISEMRTQLFSFEQKFGRLLTRNDKEHLCITLTMLDSDLYTIDKGKLCRELDYFIARFERREIK